MTTAPLEVYPLRASTGRELGMKDFFYVAYTSALLMSLFYTGRGIGAWLGSLLIEDRSDHDEDI